MESQLQSKVVPEFLLGGGEMGERMRSFDWAATSVGPVDTWPQSLRTTLSIIINSKFPMFLWWGKDLLQFYNDAYRPSLGNEGKHPTALGQKGEDCWQEIWPIIQPLIDQVMSGGEPTWSEDQLIPIYRNGRLEDVYWTFGYSPVKGEHQEVAGVLVVCTETTEKVINLKKLEESQDLLKFAIEATELGTWDFNPLTNKFNANAILKNWFGLNEYDEVELPTAISIMAENDRQRVTEAIQNALQYSSGGFYDIEYGIIHPHSGTERIVRAKGRAWFNDKKEAYRFNGTLQDITAEVTAHKKIVKSEENLRNIFKQAPVSMALFRGPQFIVEIANSTALKLWDRTLDEIIGKPIFDIMVEPGAMGFKQIMSDVYTTGKTYSAYGAAVPMMKKGVLGTRYMSFTYEALRDADGIISGVMSVAIDVTDEVIASQKMKESEQQLRSTAERLQLALSAGRLGSYELILATGEVICTPQCKENFGLQPDDNLCYEELAMMVQPNDRELMKAALKTAIDQHTLYNAEYRLLPVNGLVRWIRASGRPVYDVQGKAQKVVGVTIDITEEKNFAEELKRQVKQRTLELQRSNEDLLQFAHVASHDLKEPVRKIKTFTGRLQDELGDQLQDKNKTYLQKVQHATDRMISMIDGVLTYSTITASGQPIEIIDLNEVMSNIEADLEILINQKSATIEKSELPQIEGASVLIYQMFYNLVNNALKFSRNDTPSRITIHASMEQEEGASFAKIVMTDNGIGFEQEYADRIFDTFARLNPKDSYEGTGLGLALCKKIIERHHGTITADGSPDMGATFTITLPLKQAKKSI